MHFEIYRDKAKEFRWRLIGSNGKTVADSGEGYSRKAACTKAINSITLAIATGTLEVRDHAKAE